MIFWNVRSYSYVYLKWIYSRNMATEALYRNSWILDADYWFNSNSCKNMIFWNVKSYSCMYFRLKFTSKTWLQTIRQKQLNKLSKEWTVMSSLCGCLSGTWFWILILRRNSHICNSAWNLKYFYQDILSMNIGVFTLRVFIRRMI